MTVNLHTHTFRCGHATGSEREYIETAIRSGIKHMGFSDHMPFAFPDGKESGFRVPMAEARDYMETLQALRREYKDAITIHIGFEMEYYPLYFKDMLKLANDLGAEYLLMAGHYIRNEYPGDNHYMGKPTDSEEELMEYADTLVEAMQTGVYTYVAHPDLIKFLGDEELYREQMRKICVASRQYGVPLELNFLGIRDHRNYPKRSFWEMVAEENCEVVFGCDAHQAEVAFDGESLKTARQWVRELGLNYNPHPRLIHPKTGEITLTE